MSGSGSLTAYFGENLVRDLSARITPVFPDFPSKKFLQSASELTELGLMDRVRKIADILKASLPDDKRRIEGILMSCLPPPLPPKGQTFNDGYWMLPVAQIFPRYFPDDLGYSMRLLEALTQRGTAEFAVRNFFHQHPEEMLKVLRRWVDHPSFHVRRLASEGSRPFLPWGGRLRVSPEQSLVYLDVLSPLKNDQVSYVRRSLGNHVRDWRRIDPQVADEWIRRENPPADVEKLALPKKRPSVSTGPPEAKKED